MIKILINNEEVVCDKNLEINEEMLTTSSIILDNVYPKSWELTHDYVNNFYYPKDFSLCTINDIENITPEPGTIVTGQEITLNYDDTKQWDFELLGNIKQNSTTGINILPNNATTQVLNNVQITRNEDGSITLNGTSSRAFNLYLLNGGTETLSAGTYTMYCDGRKSGQIGIYFNSASSTRISQIGSSEADNIIAKQFTINQNTTLYSCWIYITSGSSFSNMTLYPMLYSGSEEKNYEPYTGGIPAPNPSYPYPIEIVTGENIIAINNNNYMLDLGTLELGKIDNYQDYIYKNSNNWYKKKYIEKIDSYNGETVTTQFVSTTGGLNTGSTVYYVLQNPTDEEITDTTLISQLNSINLVPGDNHIIINGNLGGILKIHYNYVTGGQIITQLFAGMVKNTGNISLNPRYPHYCSVQILSFSDFLSIGETLDFVISEKTVMEAIQMIIDTVAPYGFVLGNINILGADDVIGAYSTQDKTAYDVFNYLANITGSRWTTRMIDEHTIAVDFYDPSLMPQGTNISYTNQWFEEHEIEDISFNYGTRDYRNKQVMLSDEVYADISYTDTIIADGYNNNFLLSSNIGVMSSITVNGVEATFTLKENQDYGVSADFYYSNGSNELESDSLYTAGSQINVTYIPLVQGRQVVYNYDEVTRVAGQTERKGVIARYENRNDVTNSEELVKIGQSYLKYKGSPEINLTIKTTQNIWNVGQTVYFDAPLNELNTDYMVKSKKTLILPLNNKVFYTYTLVSSFNSENEINYFDNQRSKNAGNISQGDFITRNVDLENQALIIFSNASATEITVTGDNVLDSALDSPFMQ